jgi:hypothetical protein
MLNIKIDELAHIRARDRDLGAAMLEIVCVSRTEELSVNAKGLAEGVLNHCGLACQHHMQVRE